MRDRADPSQTPRSRTGAGCRRRGRRRPCRCKRGGPTEGISGGPRSGILTISECTFTDCYGHCRRHSCRCCWASAPRHCSLLSITSSGRTRRCLHGPAGWHAGRNVESYQRRPLLHWLNAVDTGLLTVPVQLSRWRRPVERPAKPISTVVPCWRTVTGSAAAKYPVMRGWPKRGLGPLGPLRRRRLPSLLRRASLADSFVLNSSSGFRSEPLTDDVGVAPGRPRLGSVLGPAPLQGHVFLILAVLFVVKGFLFNFGLCNFSIKASRCLYRRFFRPTCAYHTGKIPGLNILLLKIVTLIEYTL